MFLLIILSILTTANLVLGLHLLRFKYKNKKILRDNCHKITSLEQNVNSAQNRIQTLEQNLNSAQNTIKNIIKKIVLEDEKNGYKTIVLTETGDMMWGEFRQHLEMIKVIKNNIPKLNILFYINIKKLDTFKLLFTGVIDSSLIIFSELNSNIEQDKLFLQSLKPLLLFCQGPISNNIAFPNQFAPTIEVTNHPYVKYLTLDKNHNYYVKMLSKSLDKIKNLSIENKKLLFVEQNLIPILLKKREEEFQKIEVNYKEVYDKHILQFKEFRKKYSKIILFSFFNFHNCIKDGMDFFRDFLKSISQDYLVIFTIHPQYHISREFLDFANHNTDFDINLHYEIKGQKGGYKPMEMLKNEFPNFITEFDLEIKKIHGKPELPSLTNFIIQCSDGVICSPDSKVSFNVMECDKPVFGYFKNENDFCYKLLELEVKDVATYDFTKQSPKELYNKIFYFMFTRIFHKHLLGMDEDFQKFYDFIDYENEKIAKGINVLDFEFYGRENQSIEEVCEIIKNN